MYKCTPETGSGMQSTIRQLCDDTGVSSVAREIGFIDEVNEIRELKHYDEASRVRTTVPSRKRKEIDSEDDTEHSNKKMRKAGLVMKEKGLRLFSSKVCEKVEAKKTTTYNEVADELVAEFSEDATGGVVDSKNIRRRVYDALNVLMAMNIIQKDKKEIKWKGLPTQEVKQEYLALQIEKDQCEERIRRKREHLEELALHQLLYRNIIARNSREKSSENSNERIYMPFIVIHTKKDTKIDCEMSPERDRYLFEFSQPFTIHDDCEILKRMGLNDPHYEFKLGGGTPGTQPGTVADGTLRMSTGSVGPTQVTLPGGMSVGMGMGMSMGMGMGMMGLGPRLGSPVGIPTPGLAPMSAPGIPAAATVTTPGHPTNPMQMQLEQLQLAQLQQQNLRQQILQKQYEDQNRQKILQQQLQLQMQLQHFQEQHRQQMQQPPPVQVKAETEPHSTKQHTLPPPPTIRNTGPGTK